MLCRAVSGRLRPQLGRSWLLVAAVLSLALVLLIDGTGPASGQTATPGTTTVVPVADAHVAGEQPNTNFGQDAEPAIRLLPRLRVIP